jgi:hypothetical protein
MQTEFAKKIDALRSGALIAHYTVQAYVREPRGIGPLVSIGLINTETLIRYAYWARLFDYARYKNAPNARFQYVAFVELGTDVYTPDRGWLKRPDVELIPPLSEILNDPPTPQTLEWIRRRQEP